MLTVSSITNVNNTINRNISFKAGVQSNRGADVVNITSSKQEGSFLTDFLGTIQQSPLFLQTFLERQMKIEEGLKSANKLNTIV